MWFGRARDPRQAQNPFYAYALPYVWIASREKQLAGIDLHVSERVRIAPESVDPTVKPRDRCRSRLRSLNVPVASKCAAARQAE